MFFRRRPCHCTKHRLEGPSQRSRAICRPVPFSVTQSLFFITCDDKRTKSCTTPSLKTSARPCSRPPTRPSLPPGVLHTSFKKKVQMSPLQEISLNSVCYTFYIYGISYYAKIYTFQNPLLDYASINGQNHTFVFPSISVYLAQKCKQMFEN